MAAPRVRFAPSPTGFLHIGGARTALFNWLYARRHQGKFLLRIEDTDQERSTLESEKAILDGLKWLGIDWDEGPEVGGGHGPYYQTKRLETYREWAHKLLEAGKAYRCYCAREELDARRAHFEKQKLTYKYERTCLQKAPRSDRPGVIRFKMPDGDGAVTFTDKVLGRISKPMSDLDDWVMLRGDGIPLYNYGCVLDDHLMDVTLVGRGQEHVNSTFPQLLLYEALGWKPPEFAHFPLILAPSGEKLSKRKHPEADLMHHAREGILPEALMNYIVRIGWSHGDDEVISRDQMISWFDFEQVGTTSGKWSPDKLHWLNQQYLKSLPPELIAQRLLPFLKEKGIETGVDDRLLKCVLVLRARAKTLREMAETAGYFFSSGVRLDEAAAQKHLTPDSGKLLRTVRETLAGASSWAAAPLDELLKGVAERAGVGLGKIAQPIRVAVTGGTASPGIGDTLEVIGKDESLRRIDAALERIG